jgi:KDO2-lipid IV(A) lauroyltransferase
VIWVYWAWRFGMMVTGIAPHRLSLAIARFFGSLGYYMMALRRQVARENFAHVLDLPADDPQVGHVTRESFKNFAVLMRDVMLYPSLSMEELEQRVTIRNPEHLQKALARGRGAIIVSAHFGNMDLPSAILANRFTPIALVSETLRPKQLMDYLTKIRGDRKVNMNPYDRAPRKLIEALKCNEMAGFLIDFGVTHHFDMHTVPVTLFGAQTNFPTGPAQLAMLTGAAIIVGHAHVTTDGHIDVFTNPPLIPPRTGDRKRDIEITMQKIAKLMEDFIRLYPEQWYILRPMWTDAPTLKRNIPSLSQPIASRTTPD